MAKIRLFNRLLRTIDTSTFLPLLGVLPQLLPPKSIRVGFVLGGAARGMEDYSVLGIIAIIEWLHRILR